MLKTYATASRTARAPDGGYGEAPAKMDHHGGQPTAPVLQIRGQGPFAITCVDPADDPTKK